MTADALSDVLATLMREHRVPGASMAVYVDGHVIEASAGIASTATRITVTPDTLFLVGSVTKAYTATLVMQLAAEGAIDLDRSVRTYLPELQLTATSHEPVTTRQLLCHTGGLDGDYRVLDPDRGDECLKKYVETERVAQIAAPGQLFSYSNVGFRILGRLVEKLTGLTWDRALRERIAVPLTLDRTMTLPEEAILHRVAVGHVDARDSGEPLPTSVWSLPRTIAPAGGVISTAADVLTFARSHFGARSHRNAPHVLSAEHSRAMQLPQIECPDKRFADAWGLGWMLFQWDGHHVVGHDGNHRGQYACLRFLPEARFAAALLTNSESGADLARSVMRVLFAEYLDIAVPHAPPDHCELDFDATPYAGTYTCDNKSTQVEFADGVLSLTTEIGSRSATSVPPIEREALRMIDRSTFLMTTPGSKEGLRIIFFDFDRAQRPNYINYALRAEARRHAPPYEQAG